MREAARLAGTCLLLLAIPAAAAAQRVRGAVVDQTGLPLPGASVQVLHVGEVTHTLTTEGDGTFVLDDSLPGDTVVVSLDGFQTQHVPRTNATRIELLIARATETTTVTASPVEAASPTAALLGSSLTASTVARLPSSHMKARESLPLLPSVVRGADGLMQLGGARAYETPLTIDGFNVTDPATGLSSINLPFESVLGIDALRDPMAITYGGLIGGLVRIESKPGSEGLTKGVQGFMPRPRFASPGFGRLEGIFPRGHVGGSLAAGRLRYLVAAEFDYERIPVPKVTDETGQDLVEQSAIAFTRVDAQLTDRQALTFEAFTLPAATRSAGLSPRREQAATVELSARDSFAGFTYRLVSADAGVFTIQIGVFTRAADIVPNGSGEARLSPDGWSGNWFSTVHRNATRHSISAVWQRVLTVRRRPHDVTLSGEVGRRRLAGWVEEQAVNVGDADGRSVRTVEFGPASEFAARDVPVGLALRDTWQVASRVQLDAGARLDHSRHGGGAPSARAGVRYGLDAEGLTTVKAGFGRFVGNLPLVIPAFDGYPARVDRWLDPASGDVTREISYRPRVGRLHLPRANALVVGLERQISPGLDAQISYTNRRSSRLAVLQVPAESGDLAVVSGGRGHYREVQLSARRQWPNEQQLFVSYVRSSARGELNDFASVFQGMDVPLVQPGGVARTANDAHHRVLLWGTFNLPRRVVVSPVGEWRSGFPYSSLSVRQLYDGEPNSQAFPPFMAVDAVVYKTFTVKGRSADVGIQLFNLTNHHNPRDVYAVVGSSRHGQFTNSVGTIVRGYMLLKW